jgi:hypothetical protein
MTARLAGAGDNDALLALARSLVLPGVVRIGVDRSPDFFALDRIVGRESHAMLVEEGGQPVGFVDACELAVRVHHRVVRGAHLSLGGMRAEFRGRGLFRPLLDALEQRLRRQGLELAFGIANAGNDRVRRIVSAWPHGAVVAAPLHLHVLLADLTPWRRSRHVVRAATAADVARIDALVAAQRAAYDVAPVLPGSSVTSLGALTPGDFLVACDATGQVVACVALWDQSAWRRTPVIGYGRGMRALRKLGDGVSSLNGRARMPDPGGSLHIGHLAFPAAGPGAEEAFAALLRAAARQLRARQWHFLALGLPDRDPLAATITGFLRTTMTALPFVAPGNPQVASALARTEPLRAWFDYPLM